jgi:hypothetical protein
MLEKEIATDWPTPQDYNEAVQNPRICFSDADLRAAKIAVNAIGLPHAASGAFASVYKATNGTKSWAVRCFLNDRPEQKQRYKHISDFVLFDNLDSTVDFYYIDQGIKVKGKWYPCLKMTWVEGLTLDRYIEQSYADTNKMTALLKGFHQLVGELEGAGIGHGDLQHGNIIVTDQGLRLVDYDALFVPALAGLKSLEFGHPNYQHPSRTADHYDPEVDNFSCWLIHASLLCVAIDPTLYRELEGGDECILFKRKDFENPEGSKVFAKLLAHDSEHIRETANIIRRMLWAAPNTIPYLGAPPDELERLPTKPGEQRVQKPEPAAGAEPNGNGASANDLQTNDTDTAAPELLLDDPDETTLLGGAAYDFNNAFEAIDSSHMDRQKQKRNPGAQLAKLTQNTFKAGRQARDRIQKVADKLELSTIPSNWISRKLKDASELYYTTKYDEASKIYLEVFKQLDQNRHEEILSEVAISLGYCFAMDGRYSLAANYFLLFLNEGKRRYDNSRRKNECTSDELRDAAFFLAVCKFDDGNETAAFKVIQDYQIHFIDLNEMIVQERQNVYIYRWATYRFLRALATRLAKSPQSDPQMVLDLIKCASLIFMNLLIEGSSDCDDDLLNSYMDLIGVLPKLEGITGLAVRAKKLYFALADACNARGFLEQAKISSFCGAVLQNSIDGSQREAMATLANLGHTNVDEFAKLATAAGVYLRSGSVLKLLVSVGHFFKQMESKQEAADALRVASRFAPSCDAADARLVIDVLEVSDEQTIRTCLEESYFLPACPSRIRNDLILRLVEYSRANVLSVAVQLLVKTEPLDKLAALFQKIAERGDQAMFHRIMIAGAKGMTPEEASQSAKKVEEACKLVVDHCYTNLQPAKSPVDLNKFNAFSWTHYYGQIAILDNLRNYYRTVGENAKAEAIVKFLTCDDYKEVVNNWFFNLISTSGFDRYIGFVLELTTARQLESLERILTTIVKNGHITVLDGILKTLISMGHLNVLFEVTSDFARNGELIVFSNVSKEIARAADQNQIIDFVDQLIDSRSDGATYASSIIAHLIQQRQSQKTAALLAYLHEKGNLSRISFDFTEMLATSWYDSIFDRLLRKDEFGTLAELTCCIATVMNITGLRKFYNLLQSGATSEEGFRVTQEAFGQCCTKLDALLFVPSLLETTDIITPELQLSLRELNAAMAALHKLREFVGRDNFERLLEQGPTNVFSRSVSVKYDALASAWAADLVRQRDLVLLNSYTRQLALLEKTTTLLWIVNRLTREGHQDALYGICANLLDSDRVGVALDIAFHLALEHTFEAKTILANIIKTVSDDNVLFIIVERTAEINPVLADLVVRFIGSGAKAETLKPMALRYAKYNKKTALHLVLTQLLSCDPEFLPFIKRLCETDDLTEVEAIATWLVNSGLKGVIRERIENLYVFNQLDAVAEWQKYLPAEDEEL